MIGLIGNSVFSYLISHSLNKKGQTCKLYHSAEAKSPWQYYINSFDRGYLSNCLIDNGLLDSDKVFKKDLSFKARRYSVDGKNILLKDNIKDNLVELLRKYGHIFQSVKIKELLSLDEQVLDEEFFRFIEETTKSFYFFRNTQNYNDLFTNLENFPILNNIINSIKFEVFKSDKLCMLLLASCRSCIHSFLSLSELKFLFLNLIGPLYSFGEDKFIKKLLPSIQANKIEESVELLEIFKSKIKLVSNLTSDTFDKIVITSNPDLGEIQLKENQILAYNAIVMECTANSIHNELFYVIDNSIDPFYLIDFKQDKFEFFYIYQALDGQNINYYEDDLSVKLNYFMKHYYPHIEFNVSKKKNILNIWNEWDQSKSYLFEREKNPVSLKIWDKKPSSVMYYGNNAHSKLSYFYQHFFVKNQFGL